MSEATRALQLLLRVDKELVERLDVLLRLVRQLRLENVAEQLVVQIQHFLRNARCRAPLQPAIGGWELYLHIALGELAVDVFDALLERLGARQEQRERLALGQEWNRSNAAN